MMRRPHRVTAWWATMLIIGSALLRLPTSSSSRNDEDDGDDRPRRLGNVVVLLADNLGLADVSSSFLDSNKDNGRDDGGSRTPHLDRLVAEGLRFDDWASVAHLCSASRAALLTGRYPVRAGVYPRVFRPDSARGMSPEETTLAEFLKARGYATSIVGKWHLGQREPYLPTNQGFDEWTGVPYHMSGGSVDGHVCAEADRATWLPLYRDATIVRQPLVLGDLAEVYANASRSFLERHVDDPFLLYVAFSHVHQLCAPRYDGGADGPPPTCQYAARERVDDDDDDARPTFADAVSETDWIVGEVLTALDDLGLANDTLVLFTSDNGPWIAEGDACAGRKGPFEAAWARENIPLNCTACPSGYKPAKRNNDDHDRDVDRTCRHPDTGRTVQGIHCGEDTGLGSCWEANVRMPAVARWPGRISPGTVTNRTVSTLDVVPTVLSLVDGGGDAVSPRGLDGVDVSDVLFRPSRPDPALDDRPLFLWRDGFRDGPLPPPFGRFDVAAVRAGPNKAFLSTRSAHYNDDDEVHHDPPLLFDVRADPAESAPLDPDEHRPLLDGLVRAAREHARSVGRTEPRTLARDENAVPCANRDRDCRTDNDDDASSTQRATITSSSSSS